MCVCLILKYPFIYPSSLCTTPQFYKYYFFFLQAASVEALPKWNFDGSSTGQAPGDDSEVILRPCRIFKDPFRPNGENVLVMCDCYTPQGEPIATNSRAVERS